MESLPISLSLSLSLSLSRCSLCCFSHSVYFQFLFKTFLHGVYLTLHFCLSFHATTRLWFPLPPPPLPPPPPPLPPPFYLFSILSFRIALVYLPSLFSIFFFCLASSHLSSILPSFLSSLPSFLPSSFRFVTLGRHNWVGVSGFGARQC